MKRFFIMALVSMLLPVGVQAQDATKNSASLVPDAPRAAAPSGPTDWQMEQSFAACERHHATMHKKVVHRSFDLEPVTDALTGLKSQGQKVKNITVDAVVEDPDNYAAGWDGKNGTPDCGKTKSDYRARHVQQAADALKARDDADKAAVNQMQGFEAPINITPTGDQK